MKRFQWRSEAGRAVIARLDAYGEIRRLERDGQGIALTTGSGGGGRGKPGDMPGAWDLAMDVDITLREWEPTNNRMRGILDFMYRDGSQQVLVARTFVLACGERHRLTIEQIEEQQAESWRYRELEDHFGYKRTYDLAEFPDAAIDKAVCALYPYSGMKVYKKQLLETLHLDFCAFMALRRGLGEFGRVEEAS